MSMPSRFAGVFAAMCSVIFAQFWAMSDSCFCNGFGLASVFSTLAAPYQFGNLAASFAEIA